LILKNNKTVHGGGRRKVRWWWCYKVVCGSVGGRCATSTVAEEWNYGGTTE